MKTFTIENDTNNITIYASAKEAEAVPDSERFGSEAALAKLAADWPGARLVDVWNSLPGTTPVKKFKDRATAVSRIWKELQTLDGAASVPEESTPIPEMAPAAELPETLSVAEAQASETAQTEGAIPESPEPAVATPVTPQTPDGAPQEPAAPCVCPTCGRALPKPKKERSAAARVQRTVGQDGPREDSKTSQVIGLLKREGGVTLEELMAKFGWQKHTTRSMLSAGGPLIKKHGLAVTSEKVGDKRTYSIKA